MALEIVDPTRVVDAVDPDLVGEGDPVLGDVGRDRRVVGPQPGKQVLETARVDPPPDERRFLVGRRPG